MAKALIVVDVQNDFCPGGSLAVAGGDDVARRIGTWLVEAAGEYEVIVATMDWHPGPGDEAETFDHFSPDPDFVTTWPPHCVQGTGGANLHAALVLPNRAIVVRKGQDSAAYSGFEGRDDAGTPLAEILRRNGVDAVDIVGLATDYCVRATALDARNAGLDVRVFGRLIAGVAGDTTAAALDEMSAAGVTVA